MKTYKGVKELLHASSAGVGLPDTLTGELQFPAALPPQKAIQMLKECKLEAGKYFSIIHLTRMLRMRGA
jgi:hypothetical protein